MNMREMNMRETNARTCSPRMIRAKSDALDSALPRGGTLQETPLPSKRFPRVCLEPVLVKFKLISNEMIENGTFNLKGCVLFLLGGAGAAQEGDVLAADAGAPSQRVAQHLPICNTHLS